MIIVCGLPRSGSMSMAKAFQMLGYKTLFYCPLTGQGEDWISRFQGNNYDVIVDWSLVSMLDEGVLEAFNPNKVVLLTRESGWELSLDNFGVSRHADEYMADFQRGLEHMATTNIPYVVLDIVKSPRWNELCQFLKLPIPELDFPHLNQSEFSYKI